jgi:hypothetical protein
MMARKGGVPPDRVINALSVQKLLSYFEDARNKRRARHRSARRRA